MSNPIEKIATALGWMKAERNGVEVWYDPEGGHVVSLQLPEYIGEAATHALSELKEQSKIDSLIVGKAHAEIIGLRRDLAAANTVIARKDEALRDALALIEGEVRVGALIDDLRAALSLTPATVRDEVAELQTDNLALRGTVDGLQWTLEAWSAQAGELAKEFPGVDWMGVHAFIPHVRALRTRVEKAEADVAIMQKYYVAGDDMNASVERFLDCYDRLSPSHEVTKSRIEQMRCDLHKWRDAARQPTPQPHEEGKR